MAAVATFALIHGGGGSAWDWHLVAPDRMFPSAWARRHAHERLGIEPDEIIGGHYISLSPPLELADRLAAYTAETH